MATPFFALSMHVCVLHVGVVQFSQVPKPGRGRVIRLTRLNGKGFILNADLIKVLEETPDTVVTLVNGERMVVTEKADEVVARVVEYGRLLRTLRPE